MKKEIFTVFNATSTRKSFWKTFGSKLILLSSRKFFFDTDVFSLFLKISNMKFTFILKFYISEPLT